MNESVLKPTLNPAYRGNSLHKKDCSKEEQEACLLSSNKQPLQLLVPVDTNYKSQSGYYIKELNEQTQQYLSKNTKNLFIANLF